jgi:hypothetical protein
MMRVCAVLLFVLLVGCHPAPSIPAHFVLTPWPGSELVELVDDPAAQLGSNSSGATYQPASLSQPGYLWVVRNGPATLHQLSFNSASGRWSPVREWTLTTLSGATPDSESVTKTNWESDVVYIASEKEGSESKLSIIAFDTAQGAPVAEWDMTHELGNPESVELDVDSNAGWEGLTWIPDTDLITAGFYDQRLHKPYNPNDYPVHGGGLFFAALEQNGDIYAYALNQADSLFHKIAVIRAGFPHLMGLEYDRDNAALWVHCDDDCGNVLGILKIDGEPGSATQGSFVLSAVLAHPAALANANHEGIALAPEAECVDGGRQVFWVNDAGKPGSTVSAGVVWCD